MCGVEPERTVAAFNEIASWDIESVTSALAADTIDSAVGATLLVEGLRTLESAGVERARLLKKFRAGEFWATWAEVRVADTLLRLTEQPMAIELEPGRSGGAHPDWRFKYVMDDDGISVEVKAVGLSDDEAAFCARMAPALSKLLPKAGLAHGHASIDAAPPRLTKEQRRHGEREARRLIRGVPGYPAGLRGAVIVGHSTEDSYRQRIARRVSDAVRQLPTDDECWVALYWSNGAPMKDAADAIDWNEIPGHVKGVLFVGQAVAFPHRNIHCYATRVEREGSGGDIKVNSVEGPEMEEVAGLVLGSFERSSGVRATLLRVGQRTLIKRDSRQRLSPFNLLMSPDPDIPPGGDFEGRS